MVLFYGSSFSPTDLPLPRLAHQDWALLHEESPKNNPVFCYDSMISVFNHSATWSRQSSFPLTLLHLQNLFDITDNKFFVPTQDKNKFQVVDQLSPVVYVQSSCDAPSERDSYVQELMNYINIDSYGKCLNNKQLPVHLDDPAESMNDPEFLKLMAKYKFTIAFENAIGEDYITEKLWRPLQLGSIPIYMGSPSVKDWIPNDQSVILASEFDSPKSLAEYLRHLNHNDEVFEESLEHKLKAQVGNQYLIGVMKSRLWNAGNPEDERENFVEAFECFLCQKVHQKQLANLHEYSTGPPLSVDSSHFSCDRPINPVSKRENPDNWWLQHWHQTGIEAETIHQLILRNQNYSVEEFHNSVISNFQVNDHQVQ